MKIWNSKLLTVRGGIKYMGKHTGCPTYQVESNLGTCTSPGVTDGSEMPCMYIVHFKWSRHWRYRERLHAVQSRKLYFHVRLAFVACCNFCKMYWIFASHRNSPLGLESFSKYFQKLEYTGKRCKTRSGFMVLLDISLKRRSTVYQASTG